jgi:hypothetical protein
MKLKRLFQVLVIGGATLGAAACGSSSNQNQQDPDSGNNDANDGGSTQTNDGGRNPDGGPHFW